jgi:dTDP-4-dehydrorhamnose 3,5-epimerase
MENLSQIKGNQIFDERGSVRFINDFKFEGVKRFYQVENHDINFIRAWHGHKKEGKYVYVTQGVAVVAAISFDGLDNKDIVPSKYVLSSNSPSVLWIPPNHFNGFKNLTNNTNIIFFSTSTLEESKGDDIRLEYNYWDIWEPKYY